MKTLLIGFFLSLGCIVKAQTPDSVIIRNDKDLLQPVVTFDFNKPLFILNGKKISRDSLDILDPNKIKSVHVYKGLDAKEKYGDEGKNGVVVIELKAVTKKEED